MGRQLFFVASAYTLCISFSKRKNEKNSIKNFYIRRLFRISPIYYLGIIGYFTFRVLLNYIESGQVNIPEEYSLVNVMANIIFVNGIYWPANNNIVPGGWSIGTEMLFYLVFPFFMFMISRFQTNKAFILSLPFATVISNFKLFHLFVLMIGFSGILLYLGWVYSVSQAFIVIPFLSAMSFAFLLEIFNRIKTTNIYFCKK